MDVAFFASAAAWREWLAAHHDAATELQVGFYKRDAGRPSITYQEALDEALCYGWIDGVRKGLDEASYTIRFTPRKPRSNWSAVNIRRVEELSRLGLMQPPGIQAYEARDAERSRMYSYEQERHTLTEAFQQQFRASGVAWDFFQAQPPSYRKVASYWVMSAKQEATRLRRLATLIEDSAEGRRLAILTRWQKRR
jgi:uncharacterized protein YdeI (YjbR/CyaY-like superfamily)